MRWLILFKVYTGREVEEVCWEYAEGTPLYQRAQVEWMFDIQGSLEYPVFPLHFPEYAEAGGYVLPYEPASLVEVDEKGKRTLLRWAYWKMHPFGEQPNACEEA